MEIADADLAAGQTAADAGASAAKTYVYHGRRACADLHGWSVGVCVCVCVCSERSAVGRTITGMIVVMRAAIMVFMEAIVSYCLTC